jgi:hypothetical protein
MQVVRSWLLRLYPAQLVISRSWRHFQPVGIDNTGDQLLKTTSQSGFKPHFA